jgi:hypothetical protein
MFGSQVFLMGFFVCAVHIGAIIQLALLRLVKLNYQKVCDNNETV